MVMVYKVVNRVSQWAKSKPKKQAVGVYFFDNMAAHWDT